LISVEYYTQQHVTLFIIMTRAHYDRFNAKFGTAQISLHACLAKPMMSKAEHYCQFLWEFSL